MAQRSITEARNVFDQTIGLSPAQQRAAEAEISAAENEARDLAGRMSQSRVDDVAAMRDEALADLCGARDDFAALARDAELGRVSARDYASKLHTIQARQRRAERHLDDVTGAVDLVNAIDADPLAYAEGIYAKFPSIRPNFSF